MCMVKKKILTDSHMYLLSTQGVQVPIGPLVRYLIIYIYFFFLFVLRAY